MLKKRFNLQKENEIERKIYIIDKYPEKVIGNIEKEIQGIKIEEFKTDNIKNIEDLLNILKNILKE